MRCKGCDYPLWNLTARLCPECGRPFSPSEFEFVKNSVQFLCPHCNQDYYGTGPAGHLVPSEFDCVRCSARISMGQMILLPTQGVAEAQTVVDRMPWLDRRKIGAIRAWFLTVWRAMVEPARLARSIPADSSTLQAWWFSVVCHFIFLAASVAPLLVLVLFGTFAGGGRGGAGMAIGVFGGMALAGIFFCAVYMPIWGAAAHAVLRLTGSTAQPLGASVRTVCYASGANAAVAIPCIGGYFGWLWSPISATFMLRTTHQIHGFRAFMAAFSLPFITTALLILWIGLASWTTRVQVQNAQARAAAVVANAPATIAHQASIALFAHADDNAGRPPAHAIELVRDNRLSAHSLSIGGPLSSIRIGNTTMEKFQFMPEAQEDALVADAAAKLPPETIAHRLGDLVFTYHGIDLADPDPGLWVVIASPDPDNPASAPAGPVTAAKADRQLATFLPSEFPAALAAQNALRASLGLPPLPDPAAVTSRVPALGPAAGAGGT